MRIFALFVGILLLVAAAPNAKGLAAEPPYEIDVVLSLSGGAAFLGSKEADAIRAEETVVNASGGIKGRPVKFVIEDDQSNPQTAVQLVSQLVAKNVPAIIGPTLTASCAAVEPLIDKAGPLTYCLSPTVIPQSGKYMLISAPSLSDVSPVVLRYFLGRGFSRMALITSTDASGQDFERRLDAVLALPEFRGVQLVAREHFNTSDISVAAQMARIKAANPQVLLSFTVGTPFGTLLHGIHDAGLTIPVYGSGGNFTYAQMSQYEPFLPKELYLNGARGITPDPTASGPMNRAQETYFRAMREAGIRPEFSTTIPWDPTMIVVDVLRHLGAQPTAAQAHDYAEQLRGWTGIEGTYDFRHFDQRGIGEAAVALFQWDTAKGEFTMIYPGAGRAAP